MLLFIVFCIDFCIVFCIVAGSKNKKHVGTVLGPKYDPEYSP